MRFRVGQGNGLRPSVQIIITTSVHFVVYKLHEIDDMRFSSFPVSNVNLKMPSMLIDFMSICTNVRSSVNT